MHPASVSFEKGQFVTLYSSVPTPVPPALLLRPYRPVRAVVVILLIPFLVFTQGAIGLTPPALHLIGIERILPSLWRAEFSAASAWFAGWLLPLGGWRASTIWAVVVAIVIVSYQLRLRRTELRFARLLEERSRLAQEVQDTLLQGFAGVTLLIEGAARRWPATPDESAQLLTRALAEADECLHDARVAVWDMRSPLTEGISLVDALRMAGRRIAAQGRTRVVVKVKGRQRLSRDQQANVFRIAEEALNNAVRHGAPALIQLHLTLAPTATLSITDNGRGFVLEDDFSRYGGRWGLIGMRQRAEQLRGQLTIVTAPGRGTRVTLTFAAESFAQQARN